MHSMPLVIIIEVISTTDNAPAFEHSMLMNEIKALKAVGGHANIVHLLAHCTHEGMCSIMSEGVKAYA